MSRTSEQTKFEATMQRYVCHQRALDGRTRQPDLRQRARRQAHPLRRAVYPAQADRRVRYRRRDAKRVKEKRIHPHSLRHTTAIHLLKAGVDFATISQWLGHASLNTTMAYARADLDLKRQALMQVFRDAPRPPRAGRVGLERLEVAGWLRRL
jgi:integrase/recombinase XerD